MSKKITITIEGNIGSGKSSFLELFNGIDYIRTVPEPVEKWKNFKGNNLLELLYQNPEKYALPFQLYAYKTQMENHSEWKNEYCKIIERSLLSARFCFAENLKHNKKTELNYELLKMWFSTMYSAMREKLKVDLIIYVRTFPETAFKRTRERNRPEEMNISRQYIWQVHDLHDKWLLKRKIIDDTPVIVINGNKSKEALIKDYKLILQLIEDYRNGKITKFPKDNWEYKFKILPPPHINGPLSYLPTQPEPREPCRDDPAVPPSPVGRQDGGEEEEDGRQDHRGDGETTRSLASLEVKEYLI